MPETDFCYVCAEEYAAFEDPLVFCDGPNCPVVVHQACYGIVSVPKGDWYCQKCISYMKKPNLQIKCELCPSKDGAFKKTDTDGWAHVVCALYIPEVRFGNVTTMEPIILSHIPPERFKKTCCICQEQDAKSKQTHGACMQCNRAGCKLQFHVTCAQALGLLFEETGSYNDVFYRGFCQQHYSKMKKASNIKTFHPFKPLSTRHSDVPPVNNSELSRPAKRKIEDAPSNIERNFTSPNKRLKTDPTPNKAMEKQQAPGEKVQISLDKPQKGTNVEENDRSIKEPNNVEAMDVVSEQTIGATSDIDKSSIGVENAVDAIHTDGPVMSVESTGTTDTTTDHTIERSFNESVETIEDEPVEHAEIEETTKRTGETFKINGKKKEEILRYLDNARAALSDVVVSTAEKVLDRKNVNKSAINKITALADDIFSKLERCVFTDESADSDQTPKTALLKNMLAMLSPEEIIKLHARRLSADT